MGLLIDHTPHRDVRPSYSEFTFVVPPEVGEAWDRLPLEDRDAVYQAVLDALRETTGAEV